MFRLILAGLTLASLTACCGAPSTPARIDPATVKAADGSRPGQAGCIDCNVHPDFSNNALTHVVITSQLSAGALKFSYVSAKLSTAPTAAPIDVDVNAMLSGKISLAVKDFSALKTVNSWEQSTLVVEYKNLDGSGTGYEKWALKFNK